MLVKTNAFVVLERAVMDEILKEQGFQQTGCTTTECAVEVGKLLNVQKMVSGTTGKLGKTWTMDISLIDIETSQIEKSFFRDYKGEIDGLLNLMEPVAVQIANIAGKRELSKSEDAEEVKSYTLSILSSPTDAEIFINGRLTGKTPFESRAREGLKLEITIRKENYNDFSKSITISNNTNINAKLEFSEAYKQQLAEKARKDQEGKVAEKAVGEGSSRKWWWIGGGAVVIGTAAIILSSGGDDKKTEPSFPLPPGRP
jgi:hypothetical protein